MASKVKAVNHPPVTKQQRIYINGMTFPTEELRKVDHQYEDCGGRIAAIDFGTTSCSLAYYVSEAGEPKIRFLRLDEADKERVPTAILMDARGRVVDFGSNARRKFAQLPKEKKQHHHYFSEIKMALQHDKEVSWETTIMSLQQKEFYIVEVIALILKYMKEQLLNLEEVCKGLTGALEASDFSWVITVPAMWKARGKDMMRKAAYLAGIASVQEPINKLTSVIKVNGHYTSTPAKPDESHAKPRSLYLALEPESAALYCIECAKKAKPQFPSTTCYMVLDIGGGTVDITAHKVNDEGTIQVILPPCGNDWGGKKINEEFKFFVGNLIGDPTFGKYISTGDPEADAKHSADLDMLINQTFEAQKKIFGNKEEHTGEDDALIRLSHTFMKTYEEDLKKGVNALKCDDVQLADDELVLSYIQMDNFFSQSVEEIIACVRDGIKEIERQHKLESVFFVGGFGGSKYLHGRIKDTLNRSIKTFCPRDHITAIASGAVLFRQNPAIIRSRVADATYGAACAAPFQSTIHQEEYAFRDDDRKKRCNHLLLPFVMKDDIIDANYVLTHVYHPLWHFQTSAPFEIYTTSDKTVKYVCGPEEEQLPEIHKIGALTVQMRDTTDDKMRQVKLTLDFTHTEIKVEAYDLTSGSKVYTTVDFLSDI